ncbi:MAG: HAMP domain-containing histidine kinase [Clostridia bacterium]|nr:HAMP domain-containing histidine kinase [Clostridia bacterium]
MIKKLRKKFIAVAMLSVIAVLAIIIALINVVNFVNTGNDADSTIDIIAEHGGSLPSVDGFFKNEESLYRTRYFTVVITDEGEVLRQLTNTSYIATVTAVEAESYAKELYAKGRTSGYYDDYRFNAKAASVTFTADNTALNATMYIFLDCSEELDSFYAFLWASILISLAGLAVTFVLVFFLSKMAVKPMADSYEKQKRFITDASHEIKTPLTIIDANTEVLEMTNGENEWTESIRNQVKRLTSMTQKLVFLSRMDENAEKEQKTDFSLTDAVTETAQPFKTPANNKGKTFSVDAESNVTLHGNESEIRQLISVLIDNAIKYSDENGYIEISLRTLGKYKEITVKNSVNEIEQGKHNELFERFYRSDKSRNSETGGHGIGLSIAQAVVENHNGKITAKSEDGKSLTITAVLS